MQKILQYFNLFNNSLIIKGLTAHAASVKLRAGLKLLPEILKPQSPVFHISSCIQAAQTKRKTGHCPRFFAGTHGVLSPLSHLFTEVNVKKAYLSPVTSFLMSLSLALGILVSDLGGYRILTRAHAQEDTCGSQSSYTTVVGNFVKVSEGLVLGGITVRGVVVDGSVLEQGVIAGSVLINDGTVVDTNGVLVSDGSPSPEGVLVSDGAPTSEADGGPCLNGVLVSDGAPTSEASGVLVSDGMTVNGVLVSDGVTTTGGTLTGDNVQVTD